MLETLRQVANRALERLAHPAIEFLGPLIAALVIVLGAFLVARLVRWLLASTIKAAGVDRFLAHSGLVSMLGFSGRMRASQLVAGGVYWLILAIGCITALDAFNTSLTRRMAEGLILLFPRIAAAAAILLAGVWLAQFLARSALVWACNEDLPHPRRMAAAVRIGVVFVAVVVAADYLDFARSVFLAAFLILVGGAVLALSIAAGLAAHRAIERRLQARAPEERSAASLWNHL